MVHTHNPHSCLTNLDGSYTQSSLPVSSTLMVHWHNHHSLSHQFWWFIHTIITLRPINVKSSSNHRHPRLHPRTCSPQIIVSLDLSNLDGSSTYATHIYHYPLTHQSWGFAHIIIILSHPGCNLIERRYGVLTRNPKQQSLEMEAFSSLARIWGDCSTTPCLRLFYIFFMRTLAPAH